MLLIKILDFLILNTEKTAIGSIFSFCVGYTPNILNLTYTQDERDNIIFYFQIIAYSVSIIVGVLAVITYLIKAFIWIFNIKSFKK